MAVMFYAPWCEYCRQLYPSWEVIAELLSPMNNLQVGYFNCEEPPKNADTCSALGVDRYPSLYFFGYGNFYQPNGLNRSNTVRFESDLIPNALYDWIWMLTYTSRAHRYWAWLGSVLKGDSVSKDAESVRVLERRVAELSSEVERYKVLEVFDEMRDSGDVFPLVSSLQPDEHNLPLRECIAEHASEYCKYEPSERFCDGIPACARDYMIPEECRPPKCPFKRRGCVVMSNCLATDTLKRYKDRQASRRH